MQRNYESPSIAASESEGTGGGHGARPCPGLLARIAQLIWPRKTAAHLAHEAHCSERAAKYYLAGDREWSGPAVQAIVREEMRRE